MKNRKLLLAALIAASCALPLAAAAQSVAATAPAFDLPGTAQPVRLAEMKGKLVYLDFWASWCVPCKQSFPWMNEMQAKYGPQGLVVIGVSVDNKRGDAEAFLKDTPAKFTIAFDTKGDTPKTYAIKGMPSSFLIGPDGKLLLAHTGFKDADKKDIEDKIRAALAKR
jgi:cytochrome c biogenesis protein CcmG, thiol:disulfide interchange protein DsbE